VAVALLSVEERDRRAFFHLRVELVPLRRQDTGSGFAKGGGKFMQQDGLCPRVGGGGKTPPDLRRAAFVRWERAEGDRDVVVEARVIRQLGEPAHHLFLQVRIPGGGAHGTL